MKPTKKNPKKKRYKRIMLWKPWRDGGSKQTNRKGIVDRIAMTRSRRTS